MPGEVVHAAFLGRWAHGDGGWADASAAMGILPPRRCGGDGAARPQRRCQPPCRPAAPRCQTPRRAPCSDPRIRSRHLLDVDPKASVSQTPSMLPPLLPFPPISCDVAIIGGGPAGQTHGGRSAGPKAAWQRICLMPCLGGPQISAGGKGRAQPHALPEPHEPFASRYAARKPQIEPLIRAFGTQCAPGRRGLGWRRLWAPRAVVFPTDMKAACCAPGCTACAGRACSTCATAGWAGTNDHDAARMPRSPQQALDFTPSSAHVLRFATPCGRVPGDVPRPWCWPWAAAAGRGSVPMGLGAAAGRARRGHGPRAPLELRL